MNKAIRVMHQLQNGEHVIRYKESGNSMLPILKSRQPVDLAPISDYNLLKKGDIVFCKVRGNFYTHKISKIKGNGSDRQFQISNNHNHVNGWVSKNAIFGLVITIHPM